MEKNEGRPIIPDDHPRAQSLHYRHQLVDGMKAKIVTPSGLCAHGRGEAFDYMFGEKTIPLAIKAMKAAIVALKKAKTPVISVNGNVAALVPEKIVELSDVLNIPLEINIFYQAPGRIEAIKQKLISVGGQNLLGTGDVESVNIPNISSNRRIVDPRGIYQADVVLIPLEDGDRAEALVEAGKTVIAIDLNPLSRTSQKSHITIVDNLIRVIPKMIELSKEISTLDNSEINQWYNDFNQKENLNYTIKYMIDYLNNQMI
jgi:4-phosphopantoate--beta-alanine ligase